jgi:mannosylglycerate hydrolase
MDELINSLETGKLDYFIMDGQMGIIEQYLKTVPENKKAITKLNKENKLAMGP